MKKSYWFAILISIVLIAWMMSGVFTLNTSTDNKTSADKAELFKVEVEEYIAHPKQLFLTVQGQSVPNRDIMIRTQTSSPIAELLIKEGDKVAQGEIIAKLDMQDRLLELEQQQALLEANQNTLSRLEQLQQRNFQSQNELDRALTELKTAQANVARIQRDIEHTQIRAPFSGQIQAMMVEQGDFVQINTPIANLVENHPLLVEAQVAQQHIALIKEASTCQLIFANGMAREGKVTFIAPKAEQATRTFKVEIHVDNPDLMLRAGMSVEVRLPTLQVQAHYVSPALFSLDDTGNIGIKAVNEKGQVEFHSVEIAQSDSEGAWVTGLAKSVRIIITGQGFVKAGNEVEPVLKPHNVKSGKEDV